MMVAVTYDNGGIFQHFGHTEQFKLYEVQDGAIVSTAVIGNDGLAHRDLIQILTRNNIDVLICGGVCEGAKAMIESYGIKVYSGASGTADECVDKLLSGNLKDNFEAACHHDDDHGCSH